jgi:hypothetical protein
LAPTLPENIGQAILVKPNVLWVRPGAYPSVERYFPSVGSGLIRKQTRLEKFPRDKRSSLLRIFLDYGSIKIYDIGPRPNLFLLISWFVWLIFSSRGFTVLTR